jgi:hypothetical protein
MADIPAVIHANVEIGFRFEFLLKTKVELGSLRNLV